jgi:alpha/beta superfamily hydrolase
MSDSSAVTHRTIEFSTTDGVVLTGDLALPDSPLGAAIVCHPHPQYGGSRLDHVVSALHEELPRAAIASLRFDFRPRFDDGVGERLDASAAVTQLAAAAGDAPLFAVGYSFGAWIALTLGDPRIAGTVAVAPPLAVMHVAAPPSAPTLVLTPAHDQFSPPDDSERVIDSWRSAGSGRIDHETIEMADHFLAGRTAVVAERTAAWVLEQL